MNPFQNLPFYTQNQFINPNSSIIEEIIQPFKEKIKKLEEELMSKDIEIAKLKYTISQMNQMNNQFNPNNNQMMIEMQKNLIFNPGLQSGNQINMFGNMMMPTVQKETKKKKIIKRLELKFMFENKGIIIQSKSNEKIEETINKYCVKAGIKKEEYLFLFNGDKVKMKLSLEKNGINNNNKVILVIKKSEKDYNQEKNEKNIMEEKNENDDEDYEFEEEEEEDKNNNAQNLIDNIKILWEKIILIFDNYGKNISIEIGKNNNFNDVIIKYCAKNNIPISKVKNDYKFLYNSSAIDIEDKRDLFEIGLKNFSKISVIDSSEIMAA